MDFRVVAWFWTFLWNKILEVHVYKKKAVLLFREKCVKHIKPKFNFHITNIFTKWRYILFILNTFHQNSKYFCISILNFEKVLQVIWNLSLPTFKVIFGVHHHSLRAESLWKLVPTSHWFFIDIIILSYLKAFPAFLFYYSQQIQMILIACSKIINLRQYVYIYIIYIYSTHEIPSRPLDYYQVVLCRIYTILFLQHSSSSVVDRYEYDSCLFISG